MRAWLRRNRIDVLLVLFTIVLCAPIVAQDSAQPASRLALAASLAEHGTVNISGYPIGVDHALYHGQLRSDKAPGQPLLAIPAYLLSRALGAQPASHLRYLGNLGLWAVTMFSSLLPFLVLLVLVRRRVAQTLPRAATAITVAVCYGSLLLPYSVNLFGHAMAACFGYAAWLVLERAEHRVRWLVAAGFLGGMTALVEYQAAIIPAVLLVYACYRARRAAGWFVLGAVPPAVVLALYQARAFGEPWHTPFNYFAGTIDGTTRGGYTIPGVRDIFDVFFSGRGLLLTSPIIIVGLVAAAMCVKHPDSRMRVNAIVTLAIGAAYVLLVAGWSGTATLETPGPRYLVPLVPFLAVPIAGAWERVRIAVWITAAWGIALQGLVLVTNIAIGQGEPVISAYWHHIVHHQFATTTWSMAAGTTGAVLYVATVVVVGVLAFRAAREPSANRPLEVVKT
jgi:hypothetical protein